jgi:hypothetical protein
MLGTDGTALVTQGCLVAWPVAGKGGPRCEERASISNVHTGVYVRSVAPLGYRLCHGLNRRSAEPDNTAVVPALSSPVCASVSAKAEAGGPDDVKTVKPTLFYTGANNMKSCTPISDAPPAAPERDI